MPKSDPKAKGTKRHPSKHLIGITFYFILFYSILKFIYLFCLGNSPKTNILHAMGKFRPCLGGWGVGWENNKLQNIA